jgi:hypothetical protein
VKGEACVETAEVDDDDAMVMEVRWERVNDKELPYYGQSCQKTTILGFFNM